MASLVVGGITVPVSRDKAKETRDPIGGARSRMFSGRARTTVRGYKKVLTVTTNAMTSTAADALVAILVGTPPVTCSGDLLGASGSYIPEYGGRDAVTAVTGPRWVVTFTLHEV